MTAGWRRALVILTVAAITAGIAFGAWLYGLVT
jgi:hypothetical protein